MLVYRIAKRKYATDLSGEGAKLDGGRWNSVGIPLLYTSTSRSLALLEILAHSTVLPLDRVIVRLELPPRLRVYELDRSALPDGWNDEPASSISQKIGDEFVKAGKFLAMKIPSVIIPAESNILINPMHPNAGKIKILDEEILDIDPRLK